MGNRQTYYFSIISYIPDYIRAERINVGIIIFNDTYDLIDYSLLPSNTSKIRNLLTNEALSLFKETIKFLNYFLKKISNSLSMNIHTSGINLNIEGLPETIALSKLEPIITANKQDVIDNLISTYIGNEFFEKNHKTISIAKEVVKNYFEKNNIIKNHLVPRASFKPTRTSPFRYTADYAYLKENKFNIINLIPSNEESLEKWYQRNLALSTKFEKYGKIVVFYDNANLALEKKQIITDLSSSSNQFCSLEIEKNNTKSLAEFVKNDISQSNKNQVKQYMENYMFA